MNGMIKIGVIGGPETVIGFKALGLDVFPAREAAEAKSLLRKLTNPDAEDEYAILYLEENLAASLTEEIARFKDKPSPAIILIPGKDGPLGLGSSALLDAVERAVGTNIL